MQTHHSKNNADTQANQAFSSNLEAALEHAENGYAIFPAKPDKRPYLKAWQKRATTDKETIRKWWKRWPDAMPALPTGKLNGIAVLDVDRKNGKDGFEALRKAEHDPNELSHIRCDTPSGGAHFYFEWPEGLGNSATGLPSGVDVRGEGGFVIAAGAVAPSGKYEPGDFTLCNDLIGLTCWPNELLPKRTAENEHPEPSGQSVEVLRSALMAIPND